MEKIDLPAQKSNYREFPIPRKYAQTVLKLWSFRARSTCHGKVLFRILPDYTTSIVYVRGPGEKNDVLLYYGPTFKKTSFESDLEAEAFGIRLRPEIVLRTLNKGKPLAFNTIEMFPKDSPLLGSLQKSRSASASLKILQRYVHTSSEPDRDLNNDVLYVMNEIQSRSGSCRLEEVYSGLKAGKRQLQRMFKRYCRMTPKDFLKLVRVHNAARELVKSGYDHFGVITGLGYYDQSHYYREFRNLLGLNPGDFESRQRGLKHEKLVD